MVILFTGLMIALVVKIIAFAIKAAWGIGKIVLGIVFLPLTLLGLALSGFLTVAIVLTVLAGLFFLLVK